MKFQVIRVTKDVLNSPLLYRVYKLGGFAQSRTEYRMIKIGLGFIDRRKRVPLRRGTVSEAPNLRKDKPHPMTFLAPVPKLPSRPLPDVSLSIDEALKIVGVV